MKKSFTLISMLFLSITSLFAQSGAIVLTLDDAIKLAQEQSFQAKAIQHQHLTGYWNYRNFQANYRPSVDLYANPLMYRNTNATFGRSEHIASEANLRVIQNVAPLGGTLSVDSRLGGYKVLRSGSSTLFHSTPFAINYRQNLFGYNRMKWDRRIEPLRYESTKREFVESTEALNISVVNHFFDFAWLGWRLKLAKENLDDATDLIDVAKERFDSETLSRDEYLDMQLARSNADRIYKELLLQSRKAKDNFLNLLMLPADIEFDIELPETLPLEQVDVRQVFEMAFANNPELLRHEINTLYARSDVEKAKRERYFQADIGLGYSKSKNDVGSFSEVYKPDFYTQSNISLGLNVPILDWGRAKGRHEVALSRLETAELGNRKVMQQIEQNAFTFGITFNSQKSIIESAALSNSLANESYALTIDRFRDNNADVLKLTSSMKAKDEARTDYINALAGYWINYYLLRQLTLYDFEKEASLFVEF